MPPVGEEVRHNSQMGTGIGDLRFIIPAFCGLQLRGFGLAIWSGKCRMLPSLDITGFDKVHTNPVLSCLDAARPGRDWEPQSPKM